MTRRSKTVPVVDVYGVPTFKSAAEEAEWWDAHPDVSMSALEQAYGKGVVNRILNRRCGGKSVRIRLHRGPRPGVLSSDPPRKAI